MTTSLVCPFEEYLDDFKDRSVLEIGPGDGRQFNIVYPLSSFYVVADISNCVLSNDLYQYIPRFNIVDYKFSFPYAFDVVHFWYVLHHVLKEELYDFFNFVFRHMENDGIALFNTAPLDYPRGGYKSNGISTTKFKPSVIRSALTNNNLTIVSEKEINRDSTGIVLKVKKGC
jgi:SAM-dependent methyltransferase